MSSGAERAVGGTGAFAVRKHREGRLSGIVAVPGKGFFVSNEAGQTANQKSTYGRIDTTAT